jgi:hypothetical protein
MNKIILIVTFFTIAITNSYAIVHYDVKKSSFLYNNISKLKSKGIRSLAFSSLSIDERKMVWEYKFSKLLEENKETTSKRDYLNKVYGLFKSYNYANNLERHEQNVIKENASILFEEGKKIFDDPIDLINIFFELVPVKREELQKIAIENAPTSLKSIKLYPCECIAGKPGGCFGTLPDGQVVFGTCYDKYCEKPTGGGGCGWFGTEPCDAYRCGFFI